ncbi:hypothetical protein jhhlp_008458 [Lomentospora prolificans]|uniref:Uncharacterized protein n=1 Tax=Lomentospora prolificans TaxID=41688 RepID=A0A2N3MY35_9PEZI|nr:hypothetical protein jhhlp_008458 [Lomentospora prolificans]
MSMSHKTVKKPPLFQATPVFRDDGSLVIKRVLIANRGEIACRVIRTCKQQMITTVAVFADEDENSVHVKLADEAICIGPADQLPYQDIERLVQIAKSANIDGIHPGYGYLSENANFARAVAAAGMTFIGPTPDSILRLGDKRVAKEYLAQHSSVPLIPGYGGKDQDPAHLEAEADRIGYPVLIKASAGGGGKGMRVVQQKAEFQEAFLRCSSEAERSFGSRHCLIEKYIESGKHVEIQVVGDGERFISLLDRECSIQRRHQKVVEESPSPWISPKMRQDMSDAAIEIATLLKYVSAGTVEFIVDTQQETFYFLEVNTRIQVEHPITEEVLGIDIVALQLFIAAGGKLKTLPELTTVQQQGHAIEVRLCAENPFNNFLPCTGTVTTFKTASEVLGVHIPAVRYEVGVASGSSVSVHFDSMISKIVVWALDRVSAIQKLNHVLKNTVCLGLTTNQLFLQRILAHPEFQRPGYTTSFIPVHKADLLKPVNVDYVVGPMMMAAVLCSRKLGNATNALGPKLFRSIPTGFRNQPKDGKTGAREFVTCQTQVLGHDSSRDLMVTRVGADEFEVTHLQSNFTLTAAQKRVLFNKQGGVLTRRFYHAATSEPTSRFKVRLLQSGTKDAFTSGSGGELHIQLGNERHNFYGSVLGIDDYKREISIYSPHLGFSASYLISNALSWAGMFEQGKHGGGSSDAQRKYLSPMPCHILQVLAKDGSTVERGDGLLVIESMKTEIRINAEAPGIVRMQVGQGAKISEGVVMCEVLVPETDEGAEGSDSTE